MSRRVLVAAFLFLAALVAGLLAWFGVVVVQDEWSRPAGLTRLVLQFDCPSSELDKARSILKERLDKWNATEAGVSVSSSGEVLVDFRLPTPAAELDAFVARLLHRGEMEFLVAATPNHFVALGTSQADEQKKFDTWRTAHPLDPLHRYRKLTVEQGGATPGIRWCRQATRASAGTPPVERPPIALIVPKPQWRFVTSDLGSVGFGSDDLGYPAVTFEIRATRQNDFGDFTESILDQGLAIVIDDVIVTLAQVRGRLQGQTRIDGGRGGFTNREVGDMVTLLRSGALPATPELVSKEELAASRNPRTMLVIAVTIGLALAALAMVFLGVRTLRRPPDVESQEAWSDPGTR